MVVSALGNLSEKSSREVCALWLVQGMVDFNPHNLLHVYYNPIFKSLLQYAGACKPCNQDVW